eukprot:728846-Pelagomonas_calceolata.AAC.1
MKSVMDASNGEVFAVMMGSYTKCTRLCTIPWPSLWLHEHQLIGKAPMFTDMGCGCLISITSQ